MKNEQLLKVLLLLILIQLLYLGYYRISNWGNTSWDHFFSRVEVFRNSFGLKQILADLKTLFTLVGFLIILFRKKLQLNRFLKFAIQLTLVFHIFHITVCLLSTKHSYFANDTEFARIILISTILDLLMLTTSIIYFRNVNKSILENENNISISRQGRCRNWLIDLSIIIVLSFCNMHALMTGGAIFDHIDILKNSTTWFFALHAFLYYFALELMFLQTIGKLHQDSYVIVRGSRFKSILVRTLCRFIPLEPFSFFGIKGWHDKFSNTTVEKINS